MSDPGILELEMDALGATHAEIGAYLMGLWGLPDPIVEAIAFHHNPSLCPATQLEPLGVVHTANALASHVNGEGETSEVPFDMAYIENLELSGRVTVWQESVMPLGEE